MVYLLGFLIKTLTVSCLSLRKNYTFYCSEGDFMTRSLTGLCVRLQLKTLAGEGECFHSSSMIPLISEGPSRLSGNNLPELVPDKITKVFSDQWNEDCYQLLVGDIPLYRCCSNKMVQLNGILRLTGLSKIKCGSTVVQIKEGTVFMEGMIPFRGTWVPLSKAIFFATKYNLLEKIGFFLKDCIDPAYLPPPKSTPSKLKIHSAFWKQEEVDCYAVKLGGKVIFRRKDNDFVNATQIWAASGLSTQTVANRLQREKSRADFHVVRKGSPRFRGTYVPLMKAVQISQKAGVYSELKDFLVEDIHL